MLTLALLMFAGMANTAAAEEPTKVKDPSKRAAKINAYLDTIGINHPSIREFVNTAGSRIEGKNLRLAESHIEGYGRIVLHYQMKPKISSRQLELKFQPYNSNMEFTATRKSALITYTYKF